jgi:hypothetical protein
MRVAGMSGFCDWMPSLLGARELFTALLLSAESSAMR